MQGCVPTGRRRRPSPWGPQTIEPVVGRYLRLDFKGRPHRIYFEEAGPGDGRGIPLVCLHTAGADGRQYRALLNDAEITRRFRVLVFDLPWHGKSSPPPGFERERYQLTTDLYVDTVMAFCQALKLDKPVVMGCSIGGRAVLHLALRHGGYFRAAIGLQSATHADPGADTRLRDLGVLHRPDVHGQEAAAGTIPVAIGIVSIVQPFLAAGKLQVLGVVSEKRSPLLPDAPALPEIVPGFEAPPSWTGLFGPANLPPAILRRANADAVKALTAPETLQRFGELRFEQIGRAHV